MELIEEKIFTEDETFMNLHDIKWLLKYFQRDIKTIMEYENKAKD